MKRIFLLTLSLLILFTAAFSVPAYAQGEQTSNAPSLRGTSGESVDFSSLEKAYEKANSYLLSLNKKAAVYSQTSMQALLDVLSDARIIDYLSADDLSIFDSEDEAAANAIAESINSAYASLSRESEGTDLTAYEAAANTINNLDRDAYEETKSLGSATRIANILVKTSKLNYTDVLNTESTSEISCFKGTATQENIDDATRTILDALYVSIKVYTINANDVIADVSFQNGTSTGDESPYTATYGSTVIAHTDIEETVWYMDFTSNSTTRARQYQGYGESFNTKVFGNINLYAETRTDTAPNMVRIYRSYSNEPDRAPVESIAFTNESYTLPEAPAYANYNFAGYKVNGEIKSANEVIEVTGDLNIKALYTFNGSADYAVNATALENGTGFNDSVAYNTKIELKGGDNAYAWVEDLGAGRARPFAIGSDITFFASESFTLTSVTEEQFNSYNFSLPTVNLRKDGVIVQDTKVVFNGQIIEKGSSVREYGVVIGVSKNNLPVNPDNVTVNNAGSHEGYDVIRAKATQKIGANQFAIGIKGLAGKDFIYKGYVIYEKTNGEFITVYN
ncbi:MAG: hypothetical protein E7570_02720 [Ruminococcaceae bacterium]|nr:hypothetical protein [Oscillospiraceae bacterium]